MVTEWGNASCGRFQKQRKSRRPKSASNAEGLWEKKDTETYRKTGEKLREDRRFRVGRITLEIEGRS